MRRLILTAFFVLLTVSAAYSATKWFDYITDHLGGAAVAIGDADRLPVEQSGVTRTVTRELLTTGIPLSRLGDPDGDKTFNFSNRTVSFQFTNPAGGMQWIFTGAATGHVLEVLQQGGNPGADMHLLHLEAVDADPLMLHLIPGAATSRAIKTNAPGENLGPGRFNLDASGRMTWGDGVGATDAYLERLSAGIMQTGGIKVNPTGARPTCSASIRGTFWVTQGGAGVADAVDVCAKDVADSYAWRSIY
jgi:hypothetical protein